MLPKIKKIFYGWVCGQILSLAQKEYEKVVIFGIDIYTPNSYHPFIKGTISMLNEVDLVVWRNVSENIRTIIALEIRVRYGCVKNMTVIMDDHDTDLLDNPLGLVWPWLAGRLVAGAEISSHIQAGRLSVLNPKSQLAKDANLLGAEMVSRINLALGIPS